MVVGLPAIARWVQCRQPGGAEGWIGFCASTWVPPALAGPAVSAAASPRHPRRRRGSRACGSRARCAPTAIRARDEFPGFRRSRWTPFLPGIRLRHRPFGTEPPAHGLTCRRPCVPVDHQLAAFSAFRSGADYLAKPRPGRARRAPFLQGSLDGLQHRRRWRTPQTSPGGSGDIVAGRRIDAGSSAGRAFRATCLRWRIPLP